MGVRERDNDMFRMILGMIGIDDRSQQRRQWIKADHLADDPFILAALIKVFRKRLQESELILRISCVEPESAEFPSRHQIVEPGLAVDLSTDIRVEDDLIIT